MESPADSGKPICYNGKSKGKGKSCWHRKGETPPSGSLSDEGKGSEDISKGYPKGYGGKSEGWKGSKGKYYKGKPVFLKGKGKGKAGKGKGGEKGDVSATEPERLEGGASEKGDSVDGKGPGVKGKTKTTLANGKGPPTGPPSTDESSGIVKAESSSSLGTTLALGQSVESFPEDEDVESDVGEKVEPDLKLSLFLDRFRFWGEQIIATMVK